MHLSTVLKLVLALWGFTFVLAFVVLSLATKKPAGVDEKKSPYEIARTVAARQQADQEDGPLTQTIVTAHPESSHQKIASDYEEG